MNLRTGVWVALGSLVLASSSAHGQFNQTYLTGICIVQFDTETMVVDSNSPMFANSFSNGAKLYVRPIVSLNPITPGDETVVGFELVVAAPKGEKEFFPFSVSQTAFESDLVEGLKAQCVAASSSI